MFRVFRYRHYVCARLILKTDLLAHTSRYIQTTRVAQGDEMTSRLQPCFSVSPGPKKCLFCSAVDATISFVDLVMLQILHIQNIIYCSQHQRRLNDLRLLVQTFDAETVYIAWTTRKQHLKYIWLTCVGWRTFECGGWKYVFWSSFVFKFVSVWQIYLAIQCLQLIICIGSSVVVHMDLNI